MKVRLILPVDSLRGKLRNDGYYFRMYRGKQIVQRCPSVWHDTPARKAAREKFVALSIGALALASCNATRTVTTSSEYIQRGDTTVVIQTKTIESYDGSRK